MKRFFFVFLCVISIVSLMAVSAFATSEYVMVSENGTFEYPGIIPPGEYELEFDTTDNSGVNYSYHSERFTIGEYVPGEGDFEGFLVSESDVVLVYNKHPEEVFTYKILFLRGYSDEYMRDVTLAGFISDDGFVQSYDGDILKLSNWYPIQPFMSALSEGVSLFISWVGEIASLIVSSPVLLVLSIGLVVILFVLYLFRRF